MTFHNQIPVGTKPGLWTLNWTVAWTMDWTLDSELDRGLDCGLDRGLDYGLDHGLDSVVLCHLKTMKAGSPNEEQTCVQLSARLAGWFKPLRCSYSLSAHLVGKDS